MNDDLQSAYRYHRQLDPVAGRRARGCLIDARKDVAEHRPRYPADRLTGYKAWNEPGERGGRYVEHLKEAGLRFVRWADELGSADHYGWHLDPHGDGETLRGAVLQLPGRYGCPVYVPAYQRGLYRSGQWAEGESGFVVFPNEMEMGPRADSGDAYETPNDEVTYSVANSADEEARIAAEKERDYQEAWQAGSVHQALGDDLALLRPRFRALYRDMKALTPGSAAMAAVRDTLMAEAREMAEKRAERARLFEEWRYSNNAAGFADGAGLPLESL
jgi:hypothetical protein